jgi:spore coat polysaccharide biosynthesis protein SpsF
MNEQQQFWKEKYASSYIEKNSEFDFVMGVQGWKEMLKKAGTINSFLECGSNIGRNIGFLSVLYPEAKKSLIEISPAAYEVVTERYQPDSSFNGPILESDFPEKSFDLVYTIGVLIHIHPDDLLANMKKMYDYSSKYILMENTLTVHPL